MGGIGATRVFGAMLLIAGTVGLGAACQDKPLVDRFLEEHGGAKEDAGTASASGAPGRPSASAPSSASASAAHPMPPRPVPIGSSGPIQPSAPEDQQMMAIQYTIAMASPQPNDPVPDDAAVARFVEKLKPAVRGADKGKTPDDAVTLKGKRVIELNMAEGCTARTPENVLKGRAGISLDDAFQAGILVVMCRDNTWACHQSTRVREDVLCHAAPRRKKL